MTTLDLLSPEVRQDPYPLLADLRSSAAVSQVDPFGLWAVSRHEDVRTVLESSQFGLRDRTDPLGDPEPFEATLLVPEPALRSPVRAMVQRAFSPALLAHHERRVRTAAHTLVDRVLERDTLDLVGQVALPLPAAAMAELLGVGPSKRAAYMRWAMEALSPGPGVSGAERMRRLRAGLDGLTQYLNELLAQRRAEPADDRISALIAAEEGGVKLSDADVLTVVLHLLLAGNEGVADLIGNALLALTTHPGVYEGVRADTSRIPALLEETLRHNSPVLGQLRQTAQEVKLAGTTIPGGSLVVALAAAANRDGGRFPDADRFDLSRDTSGHLALGPAGQEALWAPRARLEARVALEVLFDRLPDFGRAEGEIQWCSALLFRGPRSVPFAWRDGEE